MDNKFDTVHKIQVRPIFIKARREKYYTRLDNLLDSLVDSLVVDSLFKDTQHTMKGKLDTIRTQIRDKVKNNE